MANRVREPADPNDGPVAAFGYRLRRLRQSANLTYAAIAKDSYYSRSAIHAVDQGHQLPTVEALRAFVTACGHECIPWIRERNALAAELAANKADQEKPCPRGQGLPPPDPAAVNTTADFVDGLKRLREWSGYTFRQITDRSEATGRVPSSTLCGALRRGTLPGKDLVAKFLKALDLDDCEQKAWLIAWQAIKDSESAPARSPTIPPALTAPAPAGLPRGPAGGTPAVPDRVVVATCPPARDLGDWVLVDGQWHTVDVRSPPSPAAGPVPPDRRGVTRHELLQRAVLVIVAGCLLLIAVLVLTGPDA